MLLQILLRFCLMLLPAAAMAEPGSALLPISNPTESRPLDLKPAAVIYFNDGTALQDNHAQLIRNMIREAASNLRMTIRAYTLPNESNLAAQVEKIAESDVGLIVIIEPVDIESLSKIPGLYPDVRFTVVGAGRSLYLTNVRSIAFKEPEGVYMIGVLSALHTQTGTVSIVSRDNNERSRNLAYAFQQGVKYANDDAQIIEQLGTTLNRRFAHPERVKELHDATADIVFVLDEALLEPAIAGAKIRKQLIISYDHNVTGAHPGLVLTSLINHYDLALYSTLRSYTRNDWRAGSETLGIGNSSIDYVLDRENRTLLSKDSVEQIEMVKDFVSQGVIQVNPLPQ